MASWLVALGLGLMMENGCVYDERAFECPFRFASEIHPSFPKKQQQKTMMLYYVRLSPGEVTYNHTSGGVASVIRVHLFQSQRLSLSFATIPLSHLHTYQPICPLHLFCTYHIQSSPASFTSSSISVTTLNRILSAQIPRQIQQQTKSRYRSPPPTNYIKMMSTPLVILAKLSLVPPYHND